jgi:hypothetical protein
MSKRFRLAQLVVLFDVTVAEDEDDAHWPVLLSKYYVVIRAVIFLVI